VIYVADRATTSDPFGPPVAVKGDFALDRATLSADGSTLLAVSPDRKKLLLFQREAVAKSFEPVDTSHYDAITNDLAEGELLGDPVFALGGQILLYSQYGKGNAHTVRFANRLSTGSAFSVAGELPNPELVAQSDLRRRPTAVSADFRTLFYYDEVTGTTKAGFFHDGFHFTSVSDLGDARDVQPSADCTRLYFDAVGTTSDDLFTADAI
jgi:hypothetical protein